MRIVLAILIVLGALCLWDLHAHGGHHIREATAAALNPLLRVFGRPLL